MKVKTTAADPQGNTLSTEIEADKEEVGAFLKKIVPSFVNDAGGIISDQMKYWRLMNQLRLFKKAKEKLKLAGIEAKQIPLKILLPISENSSLEEDPEVQDKWANMLANAVSGNKEVKPAYPEILKELSPIEILLLDLLYNEASTIANYKERLDQQYSRDNVKTHLALSDETIDVTLGNLFRLNILQSPGSRGASIGNYPFAMRTLEIFELTAFGYHFISSMKFLNE